MNKGEEVAAICKYQKYIAIAQCYTLRPCNGDNTPLYQYLHL